MAGFNIKYNLQKVKKHPYLYLSVTWNNLRFRTPINLIIDENAWDKNRQKFKASASNAAVMNSMLNTITEKLTNYYNDRISSDPTPLDRDEVIRAVKLIIKPAPKTIKKSFLEYFEEFIADSNEGRRLTDQGTPIQFSTIKTYTTTLNHLKTFIKLYKYDLNFENIGEEFFSLLIKYCSDKGLTNNSIGRLTKIIKSFMHYAKRRGLHNSDNFIKELRVFNQDISSISLSEDEIQKIENLQCLSLRLEKTRDLFLIQINTGMRAGDLFCLKPENINYDDGVITITSLKKQNILIIPIEQKSISILKKYNGNLPHYAHQKYNQAIQDLAKIAKIDNPVQIIKYQGNSRIEETKPKYEVVTSHTGRRSFITNLLKRGIMPEMVMQISGHTSRKSFQKYVRVSQEESIRIVREALK